jgi:hypothetical protein
LLRNGFCEDATLLMDRPIHRWFDIKGLRTGWKEVRCC